MGMRALVLVHKRLSFCLNILLSLRFEVEQSRIWCAWAMVRFGHAMEACDRQSDIVTLWI